MNILIIGAGDVGFNLAKHFSTLDHHITVIDQNSYCCEQISSKLDLIAISGSGCSLSLLKDAGLDSTDMIIAVTPNDEINLLACNFAMQANVSKRIARINSNLYSTTDSKINLEKLGVTHVIEPEQEIMKKILQYIELPGVIETANFQHDNICLRGFEIAKNMPIANKNLLEINKMMADKSILFVVINRDGENLPTTGFQKILPGDKIVALMPKESFKKFSELLDININKKISKAIVYGNNIMAMHIAQAMESKCKQVILVSSDINLGHKAADELDNIEIVHGDCTDSEFLQELNIGHCQCFIAASKDIEDNIMSCILAKTEGAKNVTAIRDTYKHDELFYSLGIDHIINIQDITLNSIIEKVQIVSLGSNLKLRTANLDIIRVKANKNSYITQDMLKNLNKLTKQQITIGCIIRDNKIIIPNGDMQLVAGDETFVFCSKDQIETVNRFFNAQISDHIKSIITK